MIKTGKGGALILLLLMILVFIPVTAYGASAVDIDRECTLSFELGSDCEELKLLSIPVTLHKVAEVTANGVYETCAEYEALKEALDSLNAGAKAKTWTELAKTAAELTPEDAQGIRITLKEGEGKLTLETGLYLVSAQQVMSAEYNYTFSPYLVALPGNSYDSRDPNKEDDTWNYNVTVGLKPVREVRLGSIVVRKTLTSFWETGQTASFIFRIEATKPVDGVLQRVYSDVIAVDFTSPGTKSIKISGIPAGATAEVTEIYRGASYELESEFSQTRVIVADTEGMIPVRVSFQNRYDRHLNGGTSVVNHFVSTSLEGEAKKMKRNHLIYSIPAYNRRHSISAINGWVSRLLTQRRYV